jgi:hypothetical protein
MWVWGNCGKVRIADDCHKRDFEGIESSVGMEKKCMGKAGLRSIYYSEL